jgi:elongation factor Ts
MPRTIGMTRTRGRIELMANYSLADIKALRERTGAGMMDVKKALEEADGDAEKALEIIRVKGLKGVGKREGRAASDGLVAAHVAPTADGEGQSGVLVEVNSETDFVAKNQTFISLADRVLAAAVESGAADADALLAAESDGTPVQTVVDETAATLGEKIVVRRVARLAGEHVEVYLHKVNKDLPPQVGVLVATDAAGAAVARDIATHVAAFSPSYLTRDEVPADVVENERRIAEETARNEGKPEAALAKIVEGRLNGFFKEAVLLDQAFAKDNKKTVAQVVAEAGGTVTGFVRYRVGA